jgi:uncharacterized membrane protein (UPF0127 family)
MSIFAGMKSIKVLRLSLAGTLIAGLFVFFACHKPATPSSGGTATSGTSAATTLPPPVIDFAEPTQAQPKLPTVRLWVGTEQMDAEMCATSTEEHTGMMFRKSMGENDGMIFNLGYTGQAGFWMKNCYVPLSVAYIDPNGVIQEIHPLQPMDTNTVFSTSYNIRFALETPQGWFDRHNIKPGTIIRTEKGSLQEAFGQGR